MNASKMKVCDTPSVRLTKRGNSLAGTVARVKDYISRHQNVKADLVLLVGTNDLSSCSVSPEILISSLENSITELKDFSNLQQIFICKIPPRFVIKTGLEKYCSIKTSHTGVNNMWILKNSTNLLSSLGHLGVHKATSIQTFDFSTLYTSIPHDLLKSRLNNIINNAFKHKNGATRYTHIKVGRNKSHFTSDPLNGDNKYTAK